MKDSIKKGFGFGLTTGVITTLGLMIGLNSGTHSKALILGGILVIAIADSLSDSLGMHISEESEKKNKPKDIWEATLSTLFAKAIIVSSFIIPVLLFELATAIIISTIWGLLLITFFSIYISKKNKLNSTKAVLEHVTIAIFVIIVSHYIGQWISTFA